MHGTVGVSLTTLKAMAYKTGWLDSAVTAGDYVITIVAPPVFNPPAGTYSSAQEVAISTITGGASIRYTTDGSDPTANSGTLYTGPLNIALPTRLKAIAYKTDWGDSSVETAEYTISPFTVGFNL